MPHYKDGSPAKVGDIVKGRGYNVPHEIIGPVVSVTPGAETCNVTVAFARLRPIGGLIFVIESGLEYGQADAFEKIA